MGVKCNCPSCVDYRKWNAIVTRGEVKELRELIEELRNRLADVEEDLSIKNVILDGDWPTSYEQLTRTTGRWAV